MESSPRCIKSQQQCEKVCFHNMCNISPFICSCCPKNQCEKLHNHEGGLNIIYWSDLSTIIQKVNKYIQTLNETLNVKYIRTAQKQYQKLKGYLQEINNNFQKKVNEARKQKSFMKNQVLQTKLKIDQNNTQNITGNEIKKFYSEITNNTFARSNLEKQIELESLRVTKLCRIINKEIQNYLQGQDDIIYNQQLNDSKILMKSNEVKQSKQQTSEIKQSKSMVYSQPQKKKPIKLNKTISTSISSLQNDKEQLQLQEAINKSIYSQRQDLLRIANNRFLQQDYEEAEIKYKEVLEEDPNNEEAQLKLARIKFNQTKYGETLNYINSILQKNPKNCECYMILGQIEEKLQGKELEINYYLKALSFSNNNVACLQKIANFYIRQKNFVKAKQFLNKIVSINFKYDTVVKRVQVFKQLEDYKSAKTDIELLIDMYPQKGELYLESGKISEKLNKQQEAIDIYTKGIAQTQQMNIYRARGIVYLKLNYYQKAVSDFQKYIKINPKDSKIYYLIAVAEKNLEQYPQAYVSIEKAVEFDLKLKYLKLKAKLQDLQDLDQKSEQTKIFISQLSQMQLGPQSDDDEDY